MRALEIGGARPVILRTWFLLTLAVWLAAVLLLATSPIGLADEVPVGLIAYWTVAVFAAAALVNAVIRSAGASRIFWTVLGAGLLFRFAGNATVAGFQIFDLVPPLFAPNDVAYGISYALIFGAIGWLIIKVARNIALVAALDTLGVMFFTGLISWHFALAPAASETSWGSLQSLLLARSGPVFDVGLLCLALVAACSDPALARRAFPLAGAFSAFLIADGLYLGIRPPDHIGGWPELFWALGVALIGLAALSADGSSGAKKPLAVFWFSPLSPAVQLAFLLALGAMRPPLPPSILWGGAVIALYLALRITMGTYASQHIQFQAGRRAKVSERDRLSTDLHDNLKQCVHSIPMMLGAYRKTREKDPEAAEAILERAIKVSGEASYRVSSPLRELQIGGASAADVRALLDQLIHDVENSFGISAEQDLQAPLEDLSSERLAATYRITTEALWNAARHSKARKIRIETRRIGSVFLLKVRDDGRGFDTGQQAAGMGLSLMRRRAAEAGGQLDVISTPGHGTTVQIRFEDD
jgi:signal transduction histidine kinase